MADFHFLLPPGPQSHEGGGAYIRNLASALAADGHGVRMAGEPVAGSTRIVDGAALSTLPLDRLAGSVGLIHHTSPLADPALRDAVRAAERERLPLLRRVIATSTAVRDRLTGEFGVPADRIAIVGPGVPDAPRSTGSGGPGCAILSIGALVPRKGHDVLLRALARLFDLPWRLTIVGSTDRDPDTAAALQALAAEAPIAGRVAFAGTLDDPSLDAEWQRADLFALATEWEGYSAPVAEALRRGLPVAVANGGAAAELVTPELGVVVNPGEVDQLSKAMRRVIFDAGLRADMAEAAWQAGQALPGWHAQAAAFIEAART